MITPDFKDTFFKHGFTDDRIPETEAANRAFDDVATKLGSTYGITFDEYCELESAVTDYVTYSQYLGFLQGFKWAVYLLTGRKDEQ